MTGTRPPGRRTVAAVAAVLVAALATAAGGLHRTTGHVDRPTAAAVPVARTELSCPAVARGTATVAAAAPRATPGNGVSAVRTLDANAATSLLAGPGRVVSLTGDRESVDLIARGRDAPGVAGVRIASRLKGPGIGAGMCAAPGAQAWFTPVSTTVGSVTWLVLTNPTSATAVVNLRFLGPKGPLGGVGQRGIAIAAGGTKRLDLAPFAPAVTAMTVGVVATQGLVVAAVQTSLPDDGGLSGTEWISPVPQPATAVLVGPGPGGRGRRELVVANTSGSDALVQVQAIGPGGAFRPTSLPTIRVRPHATVVEDVTKITGRDALAWNLTSAVPIVAGAASAVSHDFVATSGSPPIAEPAVIPVPRGSSLVVSFAARLRAGGVVAVTAFDARGRLLSVDRRSVGGDVRRWRFRTSGGSRVARRLAYLVVRVHGGRGLYGNVAFTSSNGSATVPLSSARWTVTRPTAVYQPEAGAP